MSSPDPVTEWLHRLKAGDRTNVQHLWERYYPKVVRLARQRLGSCPRRAADEEDVALSAFNSFCKGVEEGRLPKLTDRDSLWAHLFLLVIRKAHYLTKKELSKKRGGGKVLDEADLHGQDGEPGLEQFLGREPSPELAAEVAEECGRLLSCLKDDELRSVAQWKLEGYTNDEIATKLGCVRRTVERMLSVIRGLWRNRLASD